MNPSYETVITASEAERRDLFLSTAARLGTAIQNVEKDFWVCWTLDALFNGLDSNRPRLLFKGGTSLSKAFGLISRFSEDIDITVFRDDLGEPAEVLELDALSGNKRRQRLDSIRNACQEFINGPLLDQLLRRAADVLDQERFRLEPDPEDPDRQTLLFWYPSVSSRNEDSYVRSAVKIESGAKSALDPHTLASATPYVANDIPGIDLLVPNIVTVQPQRTFWDKIVILHGLRQWHDRKGVLRHGGQRVSRHYYDVYRLMQTENAQHWLNDHGLGQDCARHARVFFGSTDLGLDTAVPGSLTLSPSPAMLEALGKDYGAMSGMVFGDVPSLGDVLATVREIEECVNG